MTGSSYDVPQGKAGMTGPSSVMAMCVFDGGGPAAVGGAEGPAVAVDLLVVASSGPEHGFDGDGWAVAEAVAAAWAAVVGEVGVFVATAADALAAEVEGHAAAG
ncbi:hypothetical protein Ssi02_68020 [Sinosporangium siamense]|uniref:Uncharacterized protein n=1 Tax=Sinosporangium siamense TaxID=1367973 RepID=A0A919VAL0_9ACTN|nr:hypothetical protein Ssi02_68020 [Sinosporangium siamense]